MQEEKSLIGEENILEMQGYISQGCINETGFRQK